jgi:hypothetical protein
LQHLRGVGEQDDVVNIPNQRDKVLYPLVVAV